MTSVERHATSRLHPFNSGFVAADGGGWWPGIFDAEVTARHALTLDIVKVQAVSGAGRWRILQLDAAGTETVLANVMWVTAQVLGYNDPTSTSTSTPRRAASGSIGRTATGGAAASPMGYAEGRGTTPSRAARGGRRRSPPADPTRKWFADRTRRLIRSVMHLPVRCPRLLHSH